MAVVELDGLPYLIRLLVFIYHVHIIIRIPIATRLQS